MTRVAVAGSSGLIGSALVAALRERDDHVIRLVRRAPSGPDDVRWDPASGILDPGVLDGVDAVVNLAGAGVGDRRWSPSYKHLILASRVDSTGTLAAAVAATGRPLRVVSGSAVGFYGDRDDERLTEASPPGDGFLADVVGAWEAASAPAIDAGASVVFARTGLVMSPDGGGFGRLLRLARLGLAGPLGSGRQFWPWITLVDEVRALLHLLDHPEVTGPVNVVGPEPHQQAQIMRAIGRALGRPAVLPAPGIALRAVLGEFAGEILGGQRVVGNALADSGFVHTHDTLDTACRWLVE
ncbi:MAG: TIGR01777 family oxidoreductase [Dermatophilaceae bacterium]